MPRNDVIVKIHGIVTRLREDGARVAVPIGLYNMREHDIDQYELSGKGLPTFSLTLSEVARYLKEEITIVDGSWL